MLQSSRIVPYPTATQSSIRPPTFVAFTDNKEKLHFSSERFLMNQLRKRFGFLATPIVIKAKRR